MKRELLDDWKVFLEKKEEEDNRVPKRLVKVRFMDGTELSYFSDLEEIAIGDVVAVEGKLEEKTAIVTAVLKSFKKPKFSMRWIEKIFPVDASGEYFKVEEDVVSLDHSLTAETFLTLIAGVKPQENPAFGEDDIALSLEELENCELFEDEMVKFRGKQLFMNGCVPFISLKDGIGKAIVRGGDWYEIDFRCHRGKITFLACDCPVVGSCKHAYAVLLKLREFWKKFGKEAESDSFVLCKKECFHRIMLYAKGNVSMKL